MKRTIKSLKFKKVRIANLYVMNRIKGGDESDGCKTDSCDLNAICVPEITQGTKVSNAEEECTDSVQACPTKLTC